MIDPEDVLQFWFADAAESPAKAEARLPLWFEATAEVDARIRDRYGATVEAAARGELESWTHAPRPTLALVVLLDQLPRNIWRGTARAFAHDAQALAVARQAVTAGFPGQLAPIEQPFLVMPYEHSESLAVQHEALRFCREIVASAPPAWRPFLESFVPFLQQHYDLIARFGRFPHRNAVLGRASTPEEAAYLAGGGKTFGQG